MVFLIRCMKCSWRRTGLAPSPAKTRRIWRPRTQQVDGWGEKGGRKLTGLAPSPAKTRRIWRPRSPITSPCREKNRDHQMQNTMWKFKYKACVNSNHNLLTAERLSNPRNLRNCPGKRGMARPQCLVFKLTSFPHLFHLVPLFFPPSPTPRPDHGHAKE